MELNEKKVLLQKEAVYAKFLAENDEAILSAMAIVKAEPDTPIFRAINLFLYHFSTHGSLSPVITPSESLEEKKKKIINDGIIKPRRKKTAHKSLFKNKDPNARAIREYEKKKEFFAKRNANSNEA